LSLLLRCVLDALQGKSKKHPSRSHPCDIYTQKTRKKMKK
jgi:hypothetical protein